MIQDPKPRLFVQVALAFVLLSRLPLPRLPATAFAQSAQAVWAYPVVGTVLGALAAGLGTLALGLGVPAGLSAGLVLAVLILLSGAMHEDGLADTADGLWGGNDPDRRLEIMKDSRIGTYGVLALVVVTGLRWGAYASVLPVAPLAVVAIAALSRSVLPGLMALQRPVRSAGLSQSVGRPSAAMAGLSLAIGLLAAIFLSGPVAFALLAAALIAACSIGALAQTRIGGQTGDTLGATQQAAETAMLITLTVVLT